uniref:Uncharacterized protein n=2 Tax=Pseudoalteromonas rubra TaxID=43658 RepID=A0A0F4Q949_9GAMM|nr:hypothetical protein TW77_23655 [Pseudoalteromonas rubra]
MSLLTTPVDIAHIDVMDSRPLIYCQCCRSYEHACQSGATPKMWQQAATYVGWRHVRSEHFDLDVVCPECVAEFHQPVKHRELRKAV